MALSVWEDFETDLSAWTVNDSNWQIVTNRTYNGSQSAQASVEQSGTYLWGERDFSTSIRKIELYWQEKQLSHGGGYNLTNSNGNRVVSFGTANPQWIVANSSGTQINSGDGYDRWIRTTVTLDDANSQATIEFEDQQTNLTDSTTIGYDNSGPVTGIEVINTGNKGDLASQVADSADDMSNYLHWTDYILIEKQVPAEPSNLSTGTVTSSSIELNWTDNSTSENGFNIYRATSSGNVKSDYVQIDTAGSNVTTYTDTGLSENTTYYYRVTAYNTSGDSDITNEASAQTDTTISGTVRKGLSTVQGATIHAINDSKNRVEATATSDSNGNYSVDVTPGDVYHVTVQYDDGTNKYDEESKPFIAT